MRVRWRGCDPGPDMGTPPRGRIPLAIKGVSASTGRLPGQRQPGSPPASRVPPLPPRGPELPVGRARLREPRVGEDAVLVEAVEVVLVRDRGRVRLEERVH